MVEKDTRRKVEVEIDGETVEVIAREEAERLIDEASPQDLVAAALRAVTEKMHGFAALHLESGEIETLALDTGETLRPGPSRAVMLWTIESASYTNFAPALIGDILAEDEVEAAMAHAGEGLHGDELDEEIADAYLLSIGESYAERSKDAYFHHHGADPAHHDVLGEAREQLDEVYDPERL